MRRMKWRGRCPSADGSLVSHFSFIRLYGDLFGSRPSTYAADVDAGQSKRCWWSRRAKSIDRRPATSSAEEEKKRKKDVGGHLWCLRSTASCGAGMPWMRWPVNTEMRPRDNPLLLLLEGCVFSRAELRPACSPAAVDVITFPLYGPSTVRWRTTASSRLMAVSWRPPPWGPRALP